MGSTEQAILEAARNGKVYGADYLHRVFEFDPATLSVTQLPYKANGRFRNGGMVIGSDGAVWALNASGLVRIDPETKEVVLKHRSPAVADAGIGHRDGVIYFGSGPMLYKYKIGNSW